MEPGDYPTNVLSSNNYASIRYAYFELQPPLPGTSRKLLQRIEAAFRQDGALAHCDSSREGIWRFRSAAGDNAEWNYKGPAVAEIYQLIQAQGSGFASRETGLYEPASLAKGKLAGSSSFSTSIISSSPSSSLESTIRSSQTTNSRAVQANTSQNIINDPLISSPASKSAHMLPDTWPAPKDIHESFVSAALGSIVYSLCRHHAYVPLNSRTLIMTSSPPGTKDKPQYEMDTITLVTLDVSLTTLGVVVVKAHPDTAPGLQSLSSVTIAESPSNLSSGIPLLLAPGGNAAKLYGNRDDQTTPVDLAASGILTNPSDHHGLSDGTIQSWKSRCLDWLAAKGLDIVALEEGGWILVEILSGHSPFVNAEYPGNPMLEDLTVVPWPTLLCFQAAGTASRSVQPLSMNPLAFAEEWYLGRDERVAQSLNRQKERLAAEKKSKDQADVEARTIQSIAFSPAALRRGSNAGAMYPTPPDAIHHPIGGTPSFDGAASTPGNPNGLFPHDVEPPPQHTNPTVTGLEADIWGSTAKKDRTTTSMTFNDNNNDNDNLFDSGAVDEMFGDITDITDADFNFFDVPDADPPSQVVASPMEATGETQDTSNVHGSMEIDIAPPDSSSADVDGTADPGVAQPADDEDMVLAKADQAPNQLTNSMLEFQNDREKLPSPTISPPFDIDSVFRKVAQETLQAGSKSQIRKASIFNKVDFEDSLTTVNQKYGAQGRFAVSAEVKHLPVLESPTLPSTQYLKRRRKLADPSFEARNLARLWQNDSQIVEAPANEDQEMLYLLDSDLISHMSEPDDTSYTTGDLSLMLNPGVKRKWASEIDGAEDMASSFNALAVEYSQSIGTPLSASVTQLPLLEGDPADWALSPYFTSLEPDVQSHVLSDVDCIATAQILADQAVSRTVKIPGSIESVAEDEARNFHKEAVTKELVHTLSIATISCFEDITSCTMRSYLDIQGIPVLNQVHHRLPPRPMPHPRGINVDPTRPWATNPFIIHPPQLEVQRSDSKLSILPSAIPFWENLGLGPFQGGKDITAVCIHPDLDGIAASASNFLDQIQSAYESSRLGSHERLISKELADGLLPYGAEVVQQTNNVHHLAALRETTGRLSRILSSMPVEGRNFVVYFMYPVDNAALLVQICSAFQHLFKLYRKALSDKKVTSPNELVLQLLPLDFVVSPTSLVVPWPSEYTGLAMEVYNRCIDYTSFSSTPAILLEQPLPKHIEFKLTANPSESLMQENSCLHVAYAQSIDDRWITAAWTDNRGTKQMTASYCLGRKNEPLSTPFSDVANEIWETTLDILSHKKIHWRLVIARIGVMDPSELDFWTGLAATESNAQISLTLVTVQTDPSLRLLPKSLTLPPKTDSSQAVITPVSTPQAPSIVSPDTASTPARENATNAGTPGENQEPDTDALLIDYTDQSWGAILAHRLNNSNSLLEINPALISGYLMKRGGPNADDAPIVMEVNIVHSEVTGNPRYFHEGILRDLLGNYRGLGTLARVRGIVDGVKDVRPWHIAAAEKAVKALYMLM